MDTARDGKHLGGAAPGILHINQDPDKHDDTGPNAIPYGPAGCRAANEAAIKSDNAEHGASIEIRQINYLNNIVEQDHRAVKRVTRPMLGFQSFESAQATLAGIELIHMIRKGQMEGDEVEGLSAADPFYALVSSSPTDRG
jgi:hypothetical protein